ncbi:MAG TPA: hypothetical protein VMS64_22245 [Candidatus Methylomirabilis sp.]|nr:hypothetical protein [Candidatus Methylomirabilis sp.]
MSHFLLQLVWFGRFGNRMHQYAYGATYARLNNFEFWLPAEWEGTRLFGHQPHRVVENDEIRNALAPVSHLSSRVAATYEARMSTQAHMDAVRKYYPEAALIDADRDPDPYLKQDRSLCNASGCFFNSALYPRMSRKHLQALCEWSDEVKRLDAYKRYSDLQGLYDVAHLRRGDIADADFNRANRQEYSVISQESYLRAFRKFGFSPDSVDWVSDDFTGRWHVGRKVRWRGGWQYPTGSEYAADIVFDWVADFLKLYFARTIFRANSSFSWWAAALSPTAAVFSPVIDKRHIYGVDGTQEITVDFVEGNHPHWQYGKPDILLGD